MFLDNFVVITNTNMNDKSSLKDTLRSYHFYLELDSQEWAGSLHYSTVEGFQNNLDAMLHFGFITLRRLEFYEEYEKCKILNFMLRLYEPLARKT